MISLYHKVCQECSALVTHRYSTSFSSAIKLLHKDLRRPVYNIYGFVRFADEIVDTFHAYKKEELFNEFVEDTWKALVRKISLNPILHSFQEVVTQYHIPHDLIETFLASMHMDLYKKEYQSTDELEQYVLGSAEVVGLMCLVVFCEGNLNLYEALKYPASRLGAAFQKVNFLRDLQSDHADLNRSYFPGFDFHNFNPDVKLKIEEDIENDFKESLSGIRALPWKARYGVYTAYKYYYTLFRKIQRMQPANVLEQRVRVPDYQKFYILMQARMENSFNLI
jgi:phytoene synthase